MPDILLDPQFDDQQLIARIIDYYHRTLKETTEGLDYLRGRGITVGEAIDQFRIGYANRTLGLMLPTMDSKAGRDIRGRLQQLGLYRHTGREHMNGCVVFPITAADGSGQVVDIYGRKTSNDLRKGTPLAHAPIGSRVAYGTSRRSEPVTKSSSVRRPLRCPDILERRLSQRHLHLRAGRPDRGSPNGLP